jgi:hypothetical protein
VGPRAGLDDVEKRKFLTLLGLELRPSVVHPVCSRYTDYAEDKSGGSPQQGRLQRGNMAFAFTKQEAACCDLFATSYAQAAAFLYRLVEVSHKKPNCI